MRDVGRAERKKTARFEGAAARVGFRAAVVAMVLAVGACASRGARPQPFPTPEGPEPAPGASPAPIESPEALSPAWQLRRVLVQESTALAGAPYRDGGASPLGFDCSGFVQYVYRRAGVLLPRTVEAQFAATAAIDRIALQPGDLVFFRTTHRGPSHVGIALSADEFIHAPTERGVVRTESMSADYWRSRYVGARTVDLMVALDRWCD